MVRRLSHISTLLAIAVVGLGGHRRSWVRTSYLAFCLSFCQFLCFFALLCFFWLPSWFLQIFWGYEVLIHHALQTNIQTPAPAFLIRHPRSRLHYTLFVYHAMDPHFGFENNQALACTTLNPPVTNFVISSFLCWSKLRAYATSFHCLSVSHLGSLAASLSASCLACLSYRAY